MSARILVVDDSPTIRKVVSSILARHDYVPIEAADGIEALQRLAQGGADLVLVDFVMPRMNGYQLCMTLRQRPELADMPVVLMSAKGDKIRGKFVQQTGALDAITKPFDARGLIAVVQSALLKKEERRGRRSDAPGSAPEDEPTSSPDSAAESLSQRTSRAALVLSEHLSQLLLPEINRQRRVLGPGELSHALARALTPDALRSLSTALGEVELASQTGEVLSGDLAAISIAEILQLLEFQRKTGALALSHHHSRVTLFVRDGLLDFATYAGLPEEFLLGRYLVETGALSRERLDECIEASRAAGKVLGAFLVEQGWMSDEQLVAALTSQTSELVYEVVRWRTGRFRFLQKTEDDLASRAALGLRTGGLVMEGFRRVDEWRLIEDSFDFGDVLFRDEAAVKSLEERQALTELELRVLSAIDGETTARELVDGFEGSSFEICKVIYRLLNSRLVKRAG